MNNNTQHKGGYILLLSVLFLSAISLSIGLFVVQTGLAGSQNVFVYEQSYQALAGAEACAETALQEIRDDTPYTGSDTLSIVGGSCSYEVTSQGAQERVVEVEAVVGETVQRLRIEIESINPEIVITSWQEISDL